MAPGSQAFSNLPEPHELTSSQINARLLTLDNQLQTEQRRRMELEAMLHQVASGGHESSSNTKSVPPSSETKLTSPVPSPEKSQLRISSPGVPLRRGSQVGTARGRSPTGSRRSPAPKEAKNTRATTGTRAMEDDMIKTEEELAICKKELKVTTEALVTVQQELKQRTEELDASRGKVDALLRMVKHVLVHLVEKKEARRFSMQASKELQRRIAEPLAESFGENESKVSDYVNERLNAISEILPRWSEVHGGDNEGQYSGIASTDGESDDGDDDGASLLSEMDSLASNFDPNEMPPPLPPSATVSRRGEKSGISDAASVPLPDSPGMAAPLASQQPSEDLEEALLDIWDAIDPDEDGILSFRELRDNLLDSMPTAPSDLHAKVMAALKEGAFLMHDNGAAAYRGERFRCRH